MTFEEDQGRWLQKFYGLPNAWFNMCKYRGVIPELLVKGVLGVKIKGTPLVKLCLQHKIRLQEVSERTGISYTTICSYAKGYSKPRKGNRKRLEDLFNDLSHDA